MQRAITGQRSGVWLNVPEILLYKLATMQCIQTCPRFRGLEYNTEMSSFLGVGIEGFHCIHRCPHFRGLEYNTEISSFLSVGIEGFHCIHRCPHFRRLK